MKTQFRNTRRRFIRNALVAGSMSPLAMRMAQPVLAAAEGDVPKAIFVYMPDGVFCPKNADGTTSDSQGAWHPTGTEEPTGTTTEHKGPPPQILPQTLPYQVHRRPPQHPAGL